MSKQGVYYMAFDSSMDEPEAVENAGLHYLDAYTFACIGSANELHYLENGQDFKIKKTLFDGVYLIVTNDLPTAVVCRRLDFKIASTSNGTAITGVSGQPGVADCDQIIEHNGVITQIAKGDAVNLDSGLIIV